MAHSAGILLFRRKDNIQYLLVHPGGPYFKNKNEGWWTIPKGEPLPEEPLLEAAVREFQEETGFNTSGPYTELKPIVQKGGKKVFCWACEGDIEISKIVCNHFTIEWPPRSGKTSDFPEIDKAGWFTAEQAKEMINERQFAFIEELQEIVNNPSKQLL